VPRRSCESASLASSAPRNGSHSRHALLTAMCCEATVVCDSRSPRSARRFSLAPGDGLSRRQATVARHPLSGSIVDWSLRRARWSGGDEQQSAGATAGAHRQSTRTAPTPALPASLTLLNVPTSTTSASNGRLVVGELRLCDHVPTARVVRAPSVGVVVIAARSRRR
jgi:hypothetical protein